MIQPLKINKKVDNDAKLAQIIKENIPASEFMSADEVNSMVGKINEMVPAINVSNGGFQGVLGINEKRVDSGFYIPTESGIFINAGNVVVDLSQGINFVTYDGDKWDVAVVPIMADGKVEEGNAGFVSGGEVFSALEKQGNMNVQEILQGVIYEPNIQNRSEVIKLNTNIISISVAKVASATQKFNLEVIPVIVADTGVTVNVLPAIYLDENDFKNGYYLFKEIVTQGSSIRLSVTNKGSGNINGFRFFLSSLSQSTKDNTDVFPLNKFLIKGNNIGTNEILSTTGNYALSIVWGVKPTNYDVWVRFYEDSTYNRVIGIQRIGTSMTESNDLYSRYTFNAISKFVSFNIVDNSLKQTATIIRTKIAKIDTLENPFKDLKINRMQFLFENELQEFSSEFIQLNKLSQILNLRFSGVQPKAYKILIQHFNSNQSIVSEQEIYNNTTNDVYPIRDIPFKSKTHTIKVKIVKTSSEDKIYLNELVLSEDDSNTISKITESNKTENNENVFDFYSAQRVTKVVKEDSLIHLIKEKKGKKFSKYFFTSSNSDNVRIILKHNAPANFFNNDEGFVINIYSVEAKQETKVKILESKKFTNTNKMIVLGIKDDFIESTSLLVGDRIEVEVLCDKEINFDLEVFAITKYK